MRVHKSYSQRSAASGSTVVARRAGESLPLPVLNRDITPPGTERDSHFFYEACRCQAPSVVTTLPSVYLRAWWLAFLVRAVICPERTSIRADRQRSNTLSCIRSVANVVRVFSGRPHLISGSNRGKPQVQPGSPHLGSMFYSCCVSLGRMREVQHRSGTGVLNKPPHPTSLLPPFKGAKKPPNGTWGFLAP